MENNSGIAFPNFQEQLGVGQGMILLLQLYAS